jgi:hypothetical protein
MLELGKMLLQLLYTWIAVFNSLPVASSYEFFEFLFLVPL